MNKIGVKAIILMLPVIFGGQVFAGQTVPPKRARHFAPIHPRFPKVCPAWGCGGPPKPIVGHFPVAPPMPPRVCPAWGCGEPPVRPPIAEFNRPVTEAPDVRLPASDGTAEEGMIPASSQSGGVQPEASSATR